MHFVKFAVSQDVEWLTLVGILNCRLEAIFVLYDTYTNLDRIYSGSLKSSCVLLEFILMTSIELTGHIPCACHLDELNSLE
jgi:hypothetical protein